MEKTKALRLLLISLIGSSLLVLPCLFVLILELNIYFDESEFLLWHSNDITISISIIGEILLVMAVWLVFPIIYLWMLKHRRMIQKQGLFVIGAISNSALLILPIINICMLFMLD